MSSLFINVQANDTRSESSSHWTFYCISLFLGLDMCYDMVLRCHHFSVCGVRNIRDGFFIYVCVNKCTLSDISLKTRPFSDCLALVKSKLMTKQ